MKSLAELESIKNETLKKMNLGGEGTRIVVGMATCGIAAGARPVMNALLDEIAKRNLSGVTVSQTGCVGICRLEPVVEVYAPGGGRVTYVRMTPEKAAQIVGEHIVNGRVVTEYTIGSADK